MASLELITNLKLIAGTTRTTPPTTTELPKGYMAFGLVNGRASIWGNYNDTVVDLIQSGAVSIEIVQATGQSTTAVISQKGVTDAIGAAKTELNASITAVQNSLGTAASKNVGASAGNVPVLGSDGKLADSVIPAVAITETFVVASQAEMLALNAQAGDVAVRTDTNRSYILQKTPASTLDNWKELLTPTDSVLSVNGKTGNVVISGSDVIATFTQATTRTNIASGEDVATSFGKIMKWLADLKALAFKDKVNLGTDVTGTLSSDSLPTVPAAKLPVMTNSAKGIAQAGNGLAAISGVVSVQAGTGIKVDANGVQADVVLKIATI